MNRSEVTKMATRAVQGMATPSDSPRVFAQVSVDTRAGEGVHCGTDFELEGIGFFEWDGVMDLVPVRD